MERRPPKPPGRGSDRPSSGRKSPPKSGLESGFRGRDKGNFRTNDGKEGFRADEKRDFKPRPDRARADSGDRPQKSFGDRPDRGGDSDRPKRSFGDRPDRGGFDKPKRSYGDRPDRGGDSDRPKRSFGDRPERNDSDRPQRSYGDRPERGGDSDRPGRSFGDRPQRSYGDRPERAPDFDRPRRSFGDRPQRGGDSDRTKRSFGDRPDRGGFDKPKRSFGDRPDRGGFDKPKRSFGDRPDRGPRRDGDDRDTKRSFGPRIEVSVYGIHAVRAALLNMDREIKAIYATEDSMADLQPVLDQALEDGMILPDVTMVEREALNRALPRDAVHQGLGLDASPLEDVSLHDIIRKAEVKKKSVVVLLDQVTDPHNIGAIMRSACAFGADAIVVQSRNAPELNGLIAKTASGAAEFVPLVYETNLSRAIEALKEGGFFCLALDERGDNIADAPAYEKTLLVMGAEGPGLRPLIKEKCDLLVKLPTSGPISSLNVSNATAIALYAVTSKPA